MKKEYVIPAIKTISFSPLRHLLLAGQSYPVNDYENGGTITVGDDEDEDHENTLMLYKYSTPEL